MDRFILALLILYSMLHESGSDPGYTDQGDPSSPIAEARGRDGCSFPPRWEGSWFQTGFQTITIKGKTISSKGRCLEVDGEKYLLYNEREQCFRCVVFNEKHFNVLEYKETFCLKERAALRQFCQANIKGDAHLFSMFRLDAKPIECPWTGKWTFSYNRGGGECKYPRSTIESCISPSRVILSYQACPDVPGTESTVEELECLATWKEGLSSKYLLGFIQYRHPSSFEERFRCFVYERSKKFFKPGNSSADNSILRVAQSGDATCLGLTPNEGSRTLTLKRAPAEKPCSFPKWLQIHAQWFTLDQRSTFVFADSGLRVSNSSDPNRISPTSLSMVATCSQILEDSPLDRVMLVLHTTSECRNGYRCMVAYRRDGHIIELQMGNLARSSEDACHSSYFEQSETPYLTLVSSTPESRECPYGGRFEVTGLLREGRVLRNTCKEGINTLNVGCHTLDKIQFRSECSAPSPNSNPIPPQFNSEYYCHGHWEEQGVHYLVSTPSSRSSTSARRLCFAFRETSVTPQPRKSKNIYGRYSMEDDDEDEEVNDRANPIVLQFSSIAESCHRNLLLGVEGTIAFNVTSYGRCDDFNSGSIIYVSPLIMSILFLTHHFF